jgi:hypothetical protein
MIHEGVGAQLSHHHQRLRTGHDAGEGAVPQSGHSLYGQAGLRSSCSWHNQFVKTGAFVEDSHQK